MFVVKEFDLDMVLVFVGFDVLEGYVFFLGGYKVIVKCKYIF